MSDLRGLKVKPAPGTISIRRGNITTNCLRVIRTPRVPYWHYDVTFLDKDVRAATKWLIIDALQHQNSVIFTPRAVYDGNKNLYSRHELELVGGGNFTVKLTYPRGDFSIFLQVANAIQPIDLERTASGAGNPHQRLIGVNLMNVLLRMFPATQQGVTVKGRGFYTALDRRLEGPGALEFWRGFITSVRPGTRHYLINIDASVMPMYPECALLDALKYITGVRNLRDLNIVGGRDHGAKRLQSAIRKYAKGLRVRLTHRKGDVTKKIRDFEWTSAADYEFPQGDQLCTVQEYFHQQNQRLDFPKLPILAMFGKAAIPLELLKIVPGQPYRGVLPELQAPTLLNVATQRPQDRLRNLRGSLRSLGLDYAQPTDRQEHQSEYLRGAGIKVETAFMEIPARVLPAPGLTAGMNRALNVNDGAWNMMAKTVVRPTQVRMIAYILATPDTPGLRGNINAMESIWRDMGISEYQSVYPGKNLIATPDIPSNYVQSTIQISDFIGLQRALANIPQTAKQRGVPKNGVLVVVIVPNSAKSMREGTKWWGDVFTGVATQVLKESKIMARGLDQYARNVGLKINAKMDGINVISTSIDRKIMDDSPLIMGLDTSHPPSGSKFPTTAAMVYSIDENVTDYRSRVKFQEPRQELIQGLKDWVLGALREHSNVKKRNGPFARRVVVYRDGVSEGQFQQVLDTEVTEILAAIKEMSDVLIPAGKIRVAPKLTFIVVGKKHHVRFFPQPGTSMADRKDNSVPGTVIDTDITTPEPNVFDFYLQSHGSILGTSRPAHYSVLYDDSGLTADELEKFSHDLCHIYQIATRSVSIPAPVYYADKLAGRASIFFHNVINNSDSASMLSDDMTFENWKSHFDEVQPHADAQGRMYWL